MKYTISIGNAYDGMKLYGLFDTQSDAIDFAERWCDDEWNIVSIDVQTVQMTTHQWIKRDMEYWDTVN